MPFSFNNPLLKQRRKILRHNETDAERLLWSKLRNKQFAGLKFYRQFSLGRYILDFYCPQYRFAIELDGGQHNELKQKLYDEKRSEYLKNRNVSIVRYWDNDVLTNIRGVLEAISINLGNLDSSNSPNPS